MLNECLFCGAPTPENRSELQWIVAALGTREYYCCPACQAHPAISQGEIIDGMLRHAMAVESGQDEAERVHRLRTVRKTCFCDECKGPLLIPGHQDFHIPTGAALFASFEESEAAAKTQGWECEFGKQICPACVGARVPC